MSAVTPPNGETRRRRARLAALQYLYAAEMHAHKFKKDALKAGIMEYWRSELGDVKPETVIDMEFCETLIVGVYKSREELDEVITRYLASNWKLSRIDVLMRDLLRMGVYELAMLKDVSVATVVNEYIDVSRYYFNDGEAQFVNGLLDNVAKDIRNEERSAGREKIK